MTKTSPHSNKKVSPFEQIKKLGTKKILIASILLGLVGLVITIGLSQRQNETRTVQSDAFFETQDEQFVQSADACVSLQPQSYIDLTAGIPYGTCFAMREDSYLTCSSDNDCPANTPWCTNGHCIGSTSQFTTTTQTQSYSVEEQGLSTLSDDTYPGPCGRSDGQACPDSHPYIRGCYIGANPDTGQDQCYTTCGDRPWNQEPNDDRFYPGTGCEDNQDPQEPEPTQPPSSCEQLPKCPAGWDFSYFDSSNGNNHCVCVNQSMPENEEGKYQVVGGYSAETQNQCFDCAKNPLPDDGRSDEPSDEGNQDPQPTPQPTQSEPSDEGNQDPQPTPQPTQGEPTSSTVQDFMNRCNLGIVPQGNDTINPAQNRGLFAVYTQPDWDSSEDNSDWDRIQKQCSIEPYINSDVSRDELWKIFDQRETVLKTYLTRFYTSFDQIKFPFTRAHVDFQKFKERQENIYEQFIPRLNEGSPDRWYDPAEHDPQVLNALVLKDFVANELQILALGILTSYAEDRYGNAENMQDGSPFAGYWIYMPMASHGEAVNHHVSWYKKLYNAVQKNTDKNITLVFSNEPDLEQRRYYLHYGKDYIQPEDYFRNYYDLAFALKNEGIGFKTAALSLNTETSPRPWRDEITIVVDGSNRTVFRWLDAFWRIRREKKQAIEDSLGPGSFANTADRLRINFYTGESDYNNAVNDIKNQYDTIQNQIDWLNRQYGEGPANSFADIEIQELGSRNNSAAIIPILDHTRGYNISTMVFSEPWHCYENRRAIDGECWEYYSHRVWPRLLHKINNQ